MFIKESKISNDKIKQLTKETTSNSRITDRGISVMAKKIKNQNIGTDLIN